MEIVLTLHFTLGNTLELLVNYELLHFHTFYQEEFEDSKEIIRIEEEQTIQWPKRKSTKGRTTIYKTYT